MNRPTLVVVETGRANLASVLAAFRRLGTTGTVSSDPDLIRRADRVVLPGVGAFGDVMERLNSSGTIPALRERITAGRPVLAICLGMQVLATASEESPGVDGLGILAGTVRRFAPTAIVPQLGWNRVDGGATGLASGYAYFANSYCLSATEPGWEPAWSIHDAPFVAALERGPQLACQFHPELSGAWGATLLERWCKC